MRPGGSGCLRAELAWVGPHVRLRGVASERWMSAVKLRAGLRVW